MSLHEIDRPDGKYTKDELDAFMVFCILDTSVPYEKVCEAYDALKRMNMVTRKQLRRFDRDDIKRVLQSVGYRWANQKANYLKAFANNYINLEIADREEIVKKVKGVGMKLASMYLRNTRGEDYAVMDIHTRRWLQERLKKEKAKRWTKLSYEEEEELFKEIAQSMGKTTAELDLEIWNTMRIGNRK